ncbi:MAG: hypothetical protein SOR95_10000 [Sutterella sp.]|nr:hypothetical protein [Sutterella sp.]
MDIKFSDNNLKLESLTPNNNVILGVYEAILDNVFTDEVLKNVAITGPNTAGKSSVISTYENQKEKKFITVSLANIYNKDNSDKNFLERNILNQIVYQAKDEIIEALGFKVIKPINHKIIGILLFCIIFCIFTLFLYNGFIDEYIRYLGLNFILDYSRYFVGAGSFVGVVLIFCLLYGCLIFLIKRVSKVSISLYGNQIELEDKRQTESFFDERLSEIAFIISALEVEAIIIEDIDRFGNISIFENLRSINAMVNNWRKKNGKSIIRFIYIVRDDLLSTEDRVKLFDLIIPIIPHSHYSNALAVFTKHDGFNKIIAEIDRRLLDIVSACISDVRIIKNLLNEFIIYREKFKEENLLDFSVESENSKGNTNSNKLFSIVVYKNLFSRDFCNLLKKKGMLYNIIDELIKEDRDFYIEYDLDKCFDSNTCESDEAEKEYLPLLKYLLLNKYIDFDYYKYISYYKNYILSEEDRKFVSAVNDDKFLGYHYKIKNPYYILDDLMFFKNIECSKGILNFDLFDYIFENFGTIKEILEVYLCCAGIFRKLCGKEENRTELRKFIEAYKARGRNIEKFDEFIKLSVKDILGTIDKNLSTSQEES